MLKLREKKEGKLFVGNQQSIYRPICGCHPFYFLTFVPCEHLKQSPEVDHPEPVLFRVSAEHFHVFVVKAVT
jgi:hypothetical protein